ncbi:MAG: L,D-transpeptidase family protein [Candidatus Omnitrophica bacterium]|nr:L,D-transpeptidase family protein [Candidatus Omnitrophota bacterium]MDD5670189.1 L,D-transpeptidase family protein [Candidatus Omnitrophota bacterium]
MPNACFVHFILKYCGLALVVLMIDFHGVMAQEPSTIEARLKNAQQLKSAGKYSQAQEIYQALLKDPGVPKKQMKGIRKKLEKLNTELLFSRFAMPGSVFYTVVEGDSLREIAKKNNTTIELIKKANGLKGDKILPGMKLKVMNGTFSIKVDKSDNVLTLLLNDQVFKHYPVATGEKNSTPTGEFKIVSKVENPTWYHDGAVVAPENPENILGTRWLGFDYQGYGIHGTTKPESVGKQVSAGCVRMINEDAEELYAIVPNGTKVFVKD